jgi:hypothetical protein
MFCSKCGKQIDEEALICVHCGVGTEKYRQEQRVAQEAVASANRQQQPIYQQPVNNSMRETYQQQEPLAPGRKFILIPCIIELAGRLLSFLFTPGFEVGQVFKFGGNLYYVEDSGFLIDLIGILLGIYILIVFILGVVYYRNISKGELLRKLAKTVLICYILLAVIILFEQRFDGLGWLFFFAILISSILPLLYYIGAKKNEEAYAYAYRNASKQNGTTALQRLAASSNYVDDYKVASEWWTCTGCGKQYPSHIDSCENCADEIPEL